MNNRKTIGSLLCVPLVVSLIAGCTNGSTSAPAKGAEQPASAAPVKLSLVQPDLGRVWKEDNPATLEIEKKTNVKLSVNMVPGSDFGNKFNVMAASGELADMNRLSGFNFQNYADNGLFLDVGKLVDQYGPNLKKHISPELWELVKYKGQTLSIPYENVAGKIVPTVRRDWLDNLGLKSPTTLAEYEETLKRFTNDDPDKNGKNDTFGIGSGGNVWGQGGGFTDFSMIFGAFGMQANVNYVKDNKVYTPMISPEYKASIEYIKKLWDAKVIDPELFTLKQDQAFQKLVQSKAGSFTGWWSVATQNLLQMLKMKEINPNVKWEPMTLVKGESGKSGLVSQGSLGATINISAKAKNPEAAIRFLDYMITEEGWTLALYGVKDLHYTDITKPRTPEGQKAYDEKWLDPLQQLVSRQDLLARTDAATTDPLRVEQFLFKEMAAKYNLYQDIFYGIPLTDEQRTLGADVVKLQDEMFIKFVTGAEPLSKWDQYVADWKKKGGQKIIEAQIKKYNELKGTNYASGL